MILRRMANAVREQNWFTVGIEILIVVIGIFLGLQVTDWNEDRKDRAVRTEMLAALKDELKASNARFNRALGRNTTLRRQTIIALNALKRCTVLPDEQADVYEAFKEYQSIQSISLDRTTFNELTGTGQFSNIENQTLKSAIARVYYDFDLLEKYQTYVRRDLSNTFRIIWDHIDYGFEETDQVFDGFRVEYDISVDFNIEEFCEDRALRNAVWEIADSYGDWVLLARRIIRNIDETIVLIEKETGR